MCINNSNTLLSQYSYRKYCFINALYLNAIDYCAEKKCDHLCISTKTGAECVCSEGFELDEDSGICKGQV